MKTTHSLKTLTVSVFNIAPISAPFSLRFILQPMVAIILGIRDGLADAKAGTPPFVFSFLRHPELRKKLAFNASRSIFLPFIIGIVLDGIVQFMLFSKISFIQALLVGSFFIAIPYIAVRNFTNKIVIHKKTKRRFLGKIKRSLK